MRKVTTPPLPPPIYSGGSGASDYGGSIERNSKIINNNNNSSSYNSSNSSFTSSVVTDFIPSSSYTPSSLPSSSLSCTTPFSRSPSNNPNNKESQYSSENNSIYREQSTQNSGQSFIFQSPRNVFREISRSNPFNTFKSILLPSSPSKRNPPPRAPPKTWRARCTNYLLNLRKSATLDDLWYDTNLLRNFFFYFSSKDRCVLAQVCVRWRDILYSDPSYWKGLMPIIYYNELRSSSSRIRGNLYSSIDQRGFDSICLYGASDSEVFDFASRISPNSLKRMFIGSLRCSNITDKGLDIFLASLSQSLKKLELSGCNKISDSGLWTSLVPRLESLTILDCINIADETVAAIAQMLPELRELYLQAYHVTDTSMAYFGSSSSREKLQSLQLQHCWELGNQGVLNIAHGLPNLRRLSLSGCSKITDDAIEVIAEQLRGLKSLDLSWNASIGDAALEYIACDLSDSLQELILDRCPRLTDIGLGYIATMSQLSSLYLRWCPQIRDFGLQTICSMKSLKVLSIAGCPQLSLNGISCLVQCQQLLELELTNCPGVTSELVQFLKNNLPPECNITV
ncbi:uncharacterized protein LOC141855382 isoform X2 [Brevipalpus obovatus]|uniref:uncharacterized protein LOC141855382 isoform X2 n=1 Tax=Brevipalpus obovatus TaxID=246614 RepID=UPI003D9E9D2F